MTQSKVIGLTGGSGSGKSTVAEILRALGANIIDGDKIAREITEAGSPTLNRLKTAFGDGIINEDGTLNRRKLGETVFSDKAKLALLNEITHPVIYEKTLEMIKKNQISVIDAAALFECKPMTELCEKIIVVCADKNVRINRIQQRDGISESMAQKRINAQKNQEELAKMADFVIVNNGDINALRKLTNEVWNCL